MSENPPPPPPPPPPPSGSSPTQNHRPPSMTGPVITLVIGSVSVLLGTMIGTGPYQGAYPDEDYILTLHAFTRFVAWALIIFGGILVVVGIVWMIRRGSSSDGALSSDSFGAALPGTGVTMVPQQIVQTNSVIAEDTPTSKRNRQLAGVLQIMQGVILLLMYVSRYSDVLYFPGIIFLYFPGIITFTTGIRVLAVFLIFTGYRCFVGKSWGRKSVCWLQVWFLLSISPGAISYATAGALRSYLIFALTLFLALRGRPTEKTIT